MEFLKSLLEVKALLKNRRAFNPSVNKISFKDIRFFIIYFLKYKFSVLLAFILFLTISVIMLPLPYFSKILIDNIIPNKNFTLLIILVSSGIVILIIKMLLSLYANYKISIVGQKVLVELKKNVYENLIYSPRSLFKESNTGYLVARINEINTLNIFFSSNVLLVVIDSIEFCFILFIIFFLNWKLSLIVIMFIPLYFITLRLFNTSIKNNTLGLFEKNAHLSKNIQQSFSGIDLVKTFNTESKEVVKVKSILKEIFSKSIINNILITSSTEIIFFIGSVVSIIILLISGLQIISDQLTIGTYIAFAGYTTRLFAPINKISTLNIVIQPGIAALARIREFIMREKSNIDGKGIKHIQKVSFNNVSFAYTEGESVLKNIDFELNIGEKLGFIGPNGSGKSTIISLLYKHYNNYEGSICINNEDLKDISPSSLRKKMSLVSENLILFDDSIINNLLYGNEKIEMDEVISATSQAGIHDFIANLPSGYDTLVGERGIRLSSGQKQRLAIARAILFNPDLLIFDEPTSFIDGFGEKELCIFIREHCSDKIVILISHNLNLISIVDNIIVLNNGNIVYKGIIADFFSQKDYFSLLKEQ
jgi:ABC-type bacteriocin/lantibiotic exporter with double-glycine peptidase domain